MQNTSFNFNDNIFNNILLLMGFGQTLSHIRYKYVAGQTTVIKNIPPEIISVIFRQLATEDLLQIKLVDKQWNKLANDLLEEAIRQTLLTMKGVEEGKIENGLLIGKVIFHDGTVATGKFNADFSFGKATFPNGGVAEGKFKKGQLNGQGTITHPNGTFLGGEFKDNMLNGQGKKTFGGFIYEGEFKDNILNGQGKITLPDGTVLEGEFRDNELIDEDDFEVLADDEMFGDSDFSEGEIFASKGFDDEILIL